MGNRCEFDIDECQASPCVNGLCSNTIGSFECLCSSGFTGDLCESDIDECLSLPCGNGTCSNILGSFQCSCSPGFTGDRCNESNMPESGLSAGVVIGKQHTNISYSVMNISKGIYSLRLTSNIFKLFFLDSVALLQILIIIYN